MNNQRNWQKIVYNLFKNSSGFTLVELLVAVFLAGLLAAGVGYGLNNILQTRAETEQRNVRSKNGFRALDFIAEEVKMASQIRNLNSEDPNDPSSSYPGPPDATNNQQILALDTPNIGENTTPPTDIIYSIADYTGNNWEGPKVIYRWGPDMDVNASQPGDYAVYENEDDPGSWSITPLIDGVTDIAQNNSDYDNDNLSTYCNNNADEIIPNTEDERQGLYICIENNGSGNFTTGEVVIRTEIEDKSESSGNVEADVKDVINVNKRVFARSD